jgi:1-deoxy-D-xylulose-5-phosphate reductoisomerase
VKRVVILGSTGSIGVQTLDVVRRFPDRLMVIGLAARRQEVLSEQARAFSVPLVSIGEAERSVDFPESTTVLGEANALETLARLPEADIVVVATVGRAGLLATIAALEAGKQVALANKEVLVMAGEIVQRIAREHGGKLLPVDSEHSAIWQCLVGEDPSTIEQIILTASGGALRNLPLEALDSVSPEEALRHPTWKMGPKVTIDSATLMNKGLEVIEAHWLFDCAYERIRIALHPTSTVHSMVQFTDGSVKAQIGRADMRGPIQYALSHPQRWPNPEMRLDITDVGPLQFAEPEWDRYPCLMLALDAGRRGGTYPAALCAADEVAVELFISGGIPLTSIATLVERVLRSHVSIAQPTLEEVLAADAWARARCIELHRAGY